MENSVTIAELSFTFAVKIVSLVQALTKNREFILSKQLLRSATSIGANIQEATAANSKADFIHKMCIASKEARETRYWLRLLDKTKIVEIDFTPYLKEVEIIIKILTKIVKTSQQNLKIKT